MAERRCDLFVIGGGSGGVRAARVAAAHGARVAIAEDRRWGGTCVVRGCVPKKLLVYGSAVSALLEDARGYGWTVDARLDWPALAGAVAAEVARLSGAYAATLGRHGVELVEGRARLLAPDVVETPAGRWRARHVLIATGAAPRRPPIPGAERMITSDDVFGLPALPRRLVIVGAGYIGVEMAHVFAGLGTRVTLVHHGELPLRGFDADLRASCAEHLRARGVDLRPDTEPERVDLLADGTYVVTLAGGGGTEAAEELACDLVLAAVGRTPATAGLGLEAAGVAVAPSRAIVVDGHQRTSVPGIWAVGDVAGGPALTPVAIRQGQAFADHVFGGAPWAPVPDLVPTAVFAQPAIATVGLTEDEARARGEVAVFRSAFRPMRHAVSGRDERALIKVVCDAPTRRVLGLHVVADDAAEIVQAAAIALTAGATKDDLDRTLAIHPTVAEELVLLR